MHICNFHVFTCMNVCEPHTCHVHGGQKRASDPPELELEMATSHHLGAVNPIRILCKNHSVFSTAESSLQPWLIFEVINAYTWTHICIHVCIYYILSKLEMISSIAPVFFWRLTRLGIHGHFVTAASCLAFSVSTQVRHLGIWFNSSPLTRAHGV